MSVPRTRCALIQLHSVHDEIFPTWIRLGEALGVDVDVFTSQKNIDRDIFAASDCSRPSQYPTSCRGSDSHPQNLWFRLKTHLKRIYILALLHLRYDIVIANSITPPNHTRRFFRFIRIPMIVVVHTGKTFLDNSDYTMLKNRRETRIMTIAPFVSEFLRANGVSNAFFHPVFGLENFETEKLPNSFCIQGTIASGRRNYACLLRTAKNLTSDQPAHFHIVGKESAEAKSLSRRFDEEGVSDRFTFRHDAESYEDFYSAIARCEFLMVLVDDAKDNLKAYFRDKCTSSINVAVALGVIPVLNEELARILAVEDCSVTYPKDDTTGAVRRALSLSKDEKIALRGRLLEKREEWQAASVLNAKSAFEALTGGTR